MIWDSLLGLIGFLKDPLIPFTQRLKIGTWWQTIGGSYYKASAYSSRDLGSIPGSGRSPGVGNGNPFWYSCRGNPMDRGAWQATVRGVTESDTTEHTRILPTLIAEMSPLYPMWTWLLRDCSQSPTVIPGRRLSVSVCACYVASVVSDSVQPYELQLARLLWPQDSPGKNTRVGCMPSSRKSSQPKEQTLVSYISCVGRWVLYH